RPPRGGSLSSRTRARRRGAPSAHPSARTRRRRRRPCRPLPYFCSPRLIDESVNQRSELRLERQDRRADRRQTNREVRALAELAAYLDRAAALADDAVHRREAEARGLDEGLRREERLEDPLLCLLVHPDTVV